MPVSSLSVTNSMPVGGGISVFVFLIAELTFSPWRVPFPIPTPIYIDEFVISFCMSPEIPLNIPENSEAESLVETLPFSDIAEVVGELAGET